MEKTKQELYMERLKKWREEKQKTHASNSDAKLAKSKVTPYVGLGIKSHSTKTESRLQLPGVPKPVKNDSQALSSTSKKNDTRAMAPKLVKRISEKTNIQPGNSKFVPGKRKSDVTRASLNHNTKLDIRSKVMSSINQKSTAKCVSKPEVPKSEKRKSKETRELLQKLEKWRKDKGKVNSEKKRPEHSASTASGVHRSKGTFVKSRLFDYQNKTKDKENRNVNLQSKKVSDKTYQERLKRRHSELPKTVVYRGGILKRKSCIGSFDNDVDQADSQANKRRKLSTSAASSVDACNKNNVVNTDNTEIGQEQSCTESATKLPVAVVTPGAHTRNVRFATPPGQKSHGGGNRLRKTPKATSATRQAELEDWLKAKGRTPSKFRHLMCFHGNHDNQSHQKEEEPHTKNTLSVEELSEQMDVLEQERELARLTEKMNQMLDECMVLFDADCPVGSLLPWLNDIYKNFPCARTAARYYTCKAHVMKASLDLDAVLEIFEQATINDAKPKEEIAKCLTDTLKYVTEEKVKLAQKKSRTPRRSHMQVTEENVFESSCVVYTVSNVAPFSEQKRSTSKWDTTPAKCQVVTPVRRSTRRSLQNLPESLKDQKPSYKNLDELAGKDDILFQPNIALEALMDEAEEDD